jgi:hypothetical protein
MKIWSVTWAGHVWRYCQVVTDDNARPDDAVEAAEAHKLEFLDSVDDVDAEYWEVVSVKEIKYK